MVIAQDQWQMRKCHLFILTLGSPKLVVRKVSTDSTMVDKIRVREKKRRETEEHKNGRVSKKT